MLSATAPPAAAHINSAATFSQWYHDTSGVNHSTAGTLTLWSNGKGAYVNRWGPNGEQWPVTVQAYYCGNVGDEQTDATTGLPIPCTSKTAAPGSTNCDMFNAMMGYMQISCTAKNGSYTAVYQSGVLDGTPLDFTGDDDVWVFINRQLAVDLGGIHIPVNGSVTFGAGARTNFGLTNGQVYEVAVFQAERQTNGSTYRLTLSGFNAAPSQCTPTCGDGIVSIGEECDDGKNKNTGGYGGCTADCKLGPYCGDGIVDPDHEDCDDGGNAGKIVLEGSACPSGCRYLKIN